MINLSKIPLVPQVPLTHQRSERVLRILRQHQFNYDFEHNDSRDSELLTMSNEEVFDIIVQFEGGLASGYEIRSWVKEVYGVDL